MRDLLKDFRVRIGLAIFFVFLVLAVFGPLITKLAGKDPNKVYFDAIGQAPSSSHWLGTTAQGADVFAQVVAGARGSVLVGFLVAIITLALGASLGLLAAYTGGITDTLLNGITDTLLNGTTNVALTIAGFPLLVVLASYFGDVGLAGIAVIIALVSWPGTARSVRALSLSLRNREFVAAMRMAGESRTRLMLFEVGPHLMPMITAGFIGSFIGGVMAEAGLKFLGVGGSGTSWGSMVGEIQKYGAISLGQWWWFAPPGLCLALLGTGLVLINLALDEISNPRLKGINPRTLRASMRAEKRLRAQAATEAA